MWLGGGSEMAIFNQVWLVYGLRAQSPTYVKLCLAMCGVSVDGCDRKSELRPQRSFHLESEELNRHFAAEIPSMPNKLSQAIISCLYYLRKHANLSAKNSCLFTKSWVKSLRWNWSEMQPNYFFFNHKAQKGTSFVRASDVLQFLNVAQEMRTPAISHPSPVK